MLNRFRAEKMHKTHGDPIIIAVVILLTGLGLCALFSISYQFSLRLYGDPLKIFRKQFLFIIFFGIIGFGISRFQLKAFRPFIPFLLILTGFLLLLPFTPMGIKLNGGNRWINLGPFGTLQPSELAKLVIILYIAHLMEKKGEGKKTLNQGFLPPFIVLSLFSIIIFLQRDFSTMLFVFFLGVTLLYLAGVPVKYLIGFPFPFALGGLAMVLAYPHSRSRVLIFLRVLDDPQGAGYQIEKSLSALSRSSFFGRGLGFNMINGSSVPEAHSDFIFSAIGEEVGFIGLVFLLGLIILFAVRGFQIAWKIRGDSFQYLVASGITLSIVVQSLINIGVAIRILPTTGIPLPFFSAGGSSIMITILMASILIGISSDVREDVL